MQNANSEEFHSSGEDALCELADSVKGSQGGSAVFLLLGVVLSVSPSLPLDLGTFSVK